MTKNILVCDDAVFMRMIIKDILSKCGYNVLEAENGYRAIEEYKRSKPELVLMDITMPEINGIETLKRIMEIDKDATVVMCSAMGQESMVMESISLGAKDFIVKPFDDDRVIEAVKNVLGDELIC